MDEHHERAIEQEWPADIDKLSAKDRNGLVKRMTIAARELRVQRQAELREERIGEALVWASLHYDAERHCDRTVFIQPPGGADNRPGERLVKGKTKGMKKDRGTGMSM